MMLASPRILHILRDYIYFAFEVKTKRYGIGKPIMMMSELGLYDYLDAILTFTYLIQRSKKRNEFLYYGYCLQPISL